jgi:hypothetical protein
LSVKIARSIRSSRLVEPLAATASASRYSSVALPKSLHDGVEHARLDLPGRVRFLESTLGST